MPLSSKSPTLNPLTSQETSTQLSRSPCNRRYLRLASCHRNAFAWKYVRQKSIERSNGKDIENLRIPRTVRGVFKASLAPARLSLPLHFARSMAPYAGFPGTTGLDGLPQRLSFQIFGFVSLHQHTFVAGPLFAPVMRGLIRALTSAAFLCHRLPRR
ncbi:hypothetical protein TNCT_514551 [Trichonephila clavata]|uniref:Uncharacterized protein n=1 Tax=Trichonephila clavata TaxID=2740835 RepID=A0A8X6G9F3_TRICU|nr:hypothetical protein TNCT_514551 [Trichonephila clavata]